jgi:uncharacterized membrane protein YhhN
VADEVRGPPIAYSLVAFTSADIGIAASFGLLGSTTAKSLVGWKRYPVMYLIIIGHAVMGYIRIG